MTFEAILDQAIAMLARRGRLTYGMLKRQFQLDEDALNDLKTELLYAHPEVRDDVGRGLVWTPAAPVRAAETSGRFDAVLAAVTALLRCEGRVTYRRLMLACGLDTALLTAVCRELTFTQVAHAGPGEGLVWAGAPCAALPPLSPAIQQPARADVAGPPAAPSLASSAHVPAPALPCDVQDDGHSTAPARLAPDAERRQLTVLFCDLVGSTQLSGQLDPEDLRAVVRAYQEAAAEVIQHYEGHIAQYLGDGLLVYFGYPTAHEDDARRAVHAGLGIVEAMGTLNSRLQAEYSVALAVRLGIHTGPVVVGVMGGGARHEHLALGETPNVTARLQNLAPANAVVLSAVTARLVQSTFALEDLGTHTVHGVAEPVVVSRVRGLLASPSPDEEFVTAKVPMLIGREEESGLLRRRWGQSKAGLGQVVFISGEAGIGKSALVEGLRAQVRIEGLPRVAFRCSPYHTNSALFPVITHIEHLLQLAPDDPPDTRLAKLEEGLRPYNLPLAEVVPLLAGLLSVPLPAERYTALTLTPQQQKQQTLDTLVAWLETEAERQPVLVAWEDLHWADPTTLEYLGLLIEQAPTVSMLHVLTYRPEFTPPWPQRSHMTPLVLNHLERPQVEALMTQRTGGKTLPAEVVRYIVTKTDGVPLYIEELTKMLLTSPLLREEADQYVLTGPLHTVAIPDTLHAALMARLDQLKTAKEIAQLGAVLGREFAYELLQAIVPQDEHALQEGLAQLVHAELLYQRGRPPRARYVFKHALIQDTAYQSLLKRTRQQYHQRIAQVLAARFPALCETQPELLAHHYTEANCAAQALPLWQQAGQRAAQHSAHQEALGHLTKGVAVLQTLPDTPERTQQELLLHVALGVSLMAVKGRADPEVERVYTRARTLCQQVGDTPQLFPVLRGLLLFYLNCGQRQTAQELAEQLLHHAERQPEVAPRMLGHYLLGLVLFGRGALGEAVRHFAQAIAAYDLQQRHHLAHVYGIDLGVITRSLGALVLWLLGYPDRALVQSQEALMLAHKVGHPLSLVLAQVWLATLHQFREEAQAAYDRAVDATTFATQQGFSALFVAWGTVPQGWALTQQEQWATGVAKLREGIAASLAAGSEQWRSYFLALLAEAYGTAGQPEDGRRLLADAQDIMTRTDERFYEAELSRLVGVLHLAQASTAQVEAEGHMRHALDVARHQEAKALELRAAMSLSRLWQQQGKQAEARALLAPIYGWFTEGFDTADLQEAQALLAELAR